MARLSLRRVSADTPQGPRHEKPTALQGTEKRAGSHNPLIVCRQPVDRFVQSRRGRRVSRLLGFHRGYHHRVMIG